MLLARLYHYCELLVGELFDMVKEIEDKEDQEIFFNEVMNYDYMLNDSEFYNVGALGKIADELEELQYKLQ